MTNKICMICKLGIDPDKAFVKVTEYKDKDNIKSKGYYHIECFRERINNSKNMQKLGVMAKSMLNKANQIIGGDMIEC